MDIFRIFAPIRSWQCGMGHKINPKSFRLGITENWNSRWLNLKNYRYVLEEDEAIRRIIRKKYRQAGIDRVIIERSGKTIRITVATAKPGLVIGRSGKGVEEVRTLIEKRIRAIQKKRKRQEDFVVNIDILEIRRSEVSAAVVAQETAQSIERRLKFRRVMKQTLEKIMQYKGVEGAKIRISGRLDGSEIARVEWLAKGRVPLHTLRAKIDYAEATAFCTYGTVGIKIWIYLGDVFKN